MRKMDFNKNLMGMMDIVSIVIVIQHSFLCVNILSLQIQRTQTYKDQNIV